MAKRQTAEPEKRAGWRVAVWCEAVGVSRAKFYTLELPPRSVRLGSARIVTETPAEYLERVRRAQAVVATK